jgi:ABC-type nitrate/sulfonate/bicarbonate transport system substrate-binding protein
MKALRWLAGVAAVALVASSCGSGSTPAAGSNGGVRTIKIAVGATTAASLPLWVGMDKGIFAKHNWTCR